MSRNVESTTDVRVVPLDTGWEYQNDDENRGISEQWYLSDQNRGVWPTIPKTLEESEVSWFRVVFPIPEFGDLGGNVLLLFSELEGDISLWINGELILAENGAQGSRELDITRVVRTAADNTLIIRIAGGLGSQFTGSDVVLRIRE